MAKTPSKEIHEIEKTQEALRDSIDEAKRLAEKAEALLQKHKKTLGDQSSD
jgi:hypothetical protein